MEKRFQVFVSSTFDDLRVERSQVIQTLLMMDCIPSGMELFPAADEEQWEFIKKVINDCDYYLLIIGGKYGSVDSYGKSYTEKEYDYAVEKGLKVIALLHEKPGELTEEKAGSSPENKEKLEAFRAKVIEGRLVKFWTKPEDLAGIVALSLAYMIKTYPSIGWVRADQVSNEELLKEINELRKENLEFRTNIEKYEKSAQIKIDNLAKMGELIRLSGRYHSERDKQYYPWSVDISWEEIFKLISPYIFKVPNEDYVKLVLGIELAEKSGKKSGSLSDQDFNTVKVQLLAVGLVYVEYARAVSGGMSWFWRLTPIGEKLMYELRTVKTTQS